MFQVSPEYVNNRSPQSQEPIVPKVSNASRVRNAQRRDASANPTEPVQARPNQIRNVTRSAFVAQDTAMGADTREPYRTTTDRAGADPSRPTVSDSFNQQYAEQGIRNVTRESDPAQAAVNDSRFAASITNGTRPTRSVRQNNPSPETTNATSSANLKNRRELKAAKKLVKVINTGLGTPLFMFWISIQVPLALFGLILIAVSAAAQAAIESFWIIRTVAAIVGSAVSALSGTPVSQEMLHAPGLGIMMILFLFGLAIFIGLVFAYLLMGMKVGIRPIFGKGFLLKMGALLCVAFYIVPLINLLPLHVPYMIVMRYYPK